MIEDRSHTLTVRVCTEDYRRLLTSAERSDRKLADLLRRYLSDGLRANGRPPLMPLAGRGRPRKQEEA